MTYKTVKGKLVAVKPKSRFAFKVPEWNATLNPSKVQAIDVIAVGAYIADNLNVETLKEPQVDLSTKGKYLGLCNRSACLEPGANWYNVGSRAYYCEDCAHLINHDGCRRYNQPDLCFEGNKHEHQRYQCN